MARVATTILPRRVRFAVYRNMVQCDAEPTSKLVLKVAETREELEACFKLLHDAYVDVGFMKPDPSGMRVTIYHALPTTTTLLAKYDGRVVGTLSLIRDSALGFPMQKIFNIKRIRKAGGNIAEVSALAVHRRFQGLGGVILFPLMKIMYEYSTRFFDTQHLVIAVNPRHIGFYESILFFKRLKKNPVENYDFVNGAPAVGAHLDLKVARELYKKNYDQKEPAKNLSRYFTQVQMKNIQFPDRRFFTTNDPVMTPELLDYFFNQQTQVFSKLNDTEKYMLHSIYDSPAYQAVLPPLVQRPADTEPPHRRHTQRFSIRCPGLLLNPDVPGSDPNLIEILECWMTGFRASVDQALKVDTRLSAQIELGPNEKCVVPVRVQRRSLSQAQTYLFVVETADLSWRKFVHALSKAQTHNELENATRFLE